jgi:putative nucleotidyltransferase with HDIG domain
MNLKKITPTIRRTVAAALFFLLTSVIFLWHGPRSDHPRVGMRAPAEIIAPYTVPIPKDLKTIREEQTRARNAIPPVLDIFFPPAASVPTVLPSETKKILESPAGPSIRSSAQSVVKKIVEQGYWPEKDEVLPVTAGASPAKNGASPFNTWVAIRTATTEFRELPDNLIGKVEAESTIRHEAQKVFPQNEKLQTAFYYTAFSFLTPTLSYNDRETEARRQAAAQAVDPNKGYVLKGERIVAAHEKITRETAEKLQALAAAQPKKNYFLTLVGTCLILALVFGLGSAYLRIRKPKVWKDEPSVYLILSLGLVTFIVARVLGLLSFYLVPLGMGAILLALLVDLEVATLFAIVMSLGIGFMAAADFSLSLFLIAGALFGSYTAIRIKQKNQLFYGAIAIAVGNLVALLAMTLYHQNFSLETVRETSFAIINSILAAGGAFLLLPVTERYFGVVTTLTLTGLADLNKPLLQTMALEAPGTYHHSIIVANLAEACANAIQANPIVARAGGYFHDIGKLKKPEYFIENLSGKRNPHDKLTPKMSSLIIGAHVKDGLDIAKKERLPKTLKEIIAEHHGTTLMEPFYEKAERLKTGSAAYEFRYPGPKPHSKEAALVMIADAVEAAARAERRISASSLKKVIQETTEERLEDGQFDDCALTRQDLVKIQEALYPVLLGIFHPRVSYPKDEDRGLRSKNSSPR